MAKILYRWDDGKFEEEYLRKLERNWKKWKSVSLEEKYYETLWTLTLFLSFIQFL